MNRYLILAEYFDTDSDQISHSAMFTSRDFSAGGQIWGIYANNQAQALTRAQQIWQEQLPNNPDREFMRFIVVEYDETDRWGDKFVVNNWPDYLKNTSVYYTFKSASAR